MHPVIQHIIKNSPHLAWMEKGIAYLTVHGSKAYGTNIEGSDTDLKGFCIPSKEYYFSVNKRFEQIEDKETDTVIYEMRKFFNLASNSNPSIIEVLFTDPSDQIFVSPIGEIVLANREKFLSKRVRFSFAGYAHAQLKRIKLHRGYCLNPPKTIPTRADFKLPERTLIPQDQLMAAEAEIQKELDRYNFDFVDELNEPMKIAMRNIIAEMIAELKLTSEDQWLSAARKIGMNDNFILLMQQERAYKNAKAQWDKYQEWKINRNPKRAELEEKYTYDCKHAMHLVRLLRLCREIMTTGKVLVKRPDREELIAIRNGAWKYEQVVEFAEKEDRELQVIYETSNVLPKAPDMNYLDNLCIQLIEKALASV